MITVIGHAARVLQRADVLTEGEAYLAADALAAAGLLTPDPTYRDVPLVGLTWAEEDGVPEGYVHLTFRVPETGRKFNAKDRATIHLATSHADKGTTE